MCQVNSEDGLMHDFVDVERMERLITKSLDASRGTSIPAIKRCLPRTPYLRSSDDRCRHTRLSFHVKQQCLSHIRNPFKSLFSSQTLKQALSNIAYLTLLTTGSSSTTGPGSSSPSGPRTSWSRSTAPGTSATASCWTAS